MILNELILNTYHVESVNGKNEFKRYENVFEVC